MLAKNKILLSLFGLILIFLVIFSLDNWRPFGNQIPTIKSTENVILQDGSSYEITASPVISEIEGNDVTMFAYNGSIPGPTIRIVQGATIYLTLNNNIDVETTLHSHGVRLENAFDGVAEVTQETIKPHGSFTYKITFPDPGVYWYHPHVREDYAQEMGLYGNFIVVPNDTAYWAEVDREETLFLDDILIENGQIAPFDKKTVTHTLMGRFGNTMLINGKDDFVLQAKQGERLRLYVTNAANTRVFNFAIPNTRMKLVGSDSGKYEREEWVDSVIIGPSERYIVEVYFTDSGNYTINNLTPDKTYTMGTIEVEPGPFTTSYLPVTRNNEDTIKELSQYRTFVDKVPDKSLVLSMIMGSASSSNTMENNEHGMHMMSNGQMMNNNSMQMGSDEGLIEWEDTMSMMNQGSTNETLTWKLIDSVTNKENMGINWQFKNGDKVKIRIFNDPDTMHSMQHPIHFHGQRFLVLAKDGKTNDNFFWKDTVLIGKGETIDILLDITNPGDWMMHCHIPEHMEAGMMSLFEVS